MSRLKVKIVREPKRRKEVLKFSENVAFEYHQCAPSAPPEFLLGAYLDGEVAGSAGLDFDYDEKKLPITEHWRLNEAEFPFPAKNIA